MKDFLSRLLSRSKAQSAAAEAESDDLPPPASGRSGETVFSAENVDPALRFRSLTLAEPEPASLQGAPDGQPAFKIRLAKLSGSRRVAGGLVGQRYQDRGYLVPTATADPNLYSFLAYDEGRVVGTVSIRLDSSKGLSADELYRGELDEFRRNGSRICEFTRLAVDVKTASKPVLAGLFHTAYLYASAIRDFDFAVIEVNPRHMAFYRRALRFEPIGPERINKRVDAPAVLLCVAFAAIEQGIREFGGKPELALRERSLFPYGFSSSEEQGILDRLRHLDRPATTTS